MAATIISISSDVSVESVGSSFPPVILIGSISVEVPVEPEVGAAAVASPVGVLELDTHSSPCRALTARKSVRPLPSHRLELRYTSHHLDHFTSGSTSSHSLFGHSISGHSLSGHTPPDTTDADLSTPSRFVHPLLARTPRCTKACLRWRSSPLSTMYPPMTSKSLAGDSSSESSARSSHKRCRSSATTVTSFIHATRPLVPSRIDLLPPRKRFRDSISPKDSVEEDIETHVLADIKVDPTTIEVAVDRDVEAGVDAGIGMEVDVRVDVEDEVKDEVESNDRGTIEVKVDVVTGIDILDGMLMPGAVEHLEHVEEGLQDIYEHVIEIPLQRIEDIKTGQRELEARSLIADGERASLLDQVRETSRHHDDGESESWRLETFTVRRLELVNIRVEEALAAYEATRAANALEAKSQSQNSSDGDNGNGGDGNGRNGNGGNGNVGNGNPNENNRNVRPVVRECTNAVVVRLQQ
ncbi:hypothetical protein Tco_0154059 [Tanacetum coccineum]